MHVQQAIAQTVDCFQRSALPNQMYRIDVSPLSSLQSLEKQSCVRSFFYTCLSPIFAIGNGILKVIVFLRDKLCCCKYGSSDVKLDLIKAKKAFVHVHSIVLTSEDPDAQKKLTHALKRLSPNAMERFKRHIGWAIAAHKSPAIEERSKQEEWAEENWSNIQSDIEECLKDPHNAKLKKAVESFWKEIGRGDPDSE